MKNSIQSYDLFRHQRGVLAFFFGLSVGEGWLCLFVARGVGFQLPTDKCLMHGGVHSVLDFCMSMSMMS